MEAYAVNGLVGGRAATGTSAAWVQSARFDLAFFILAPLVALPVLLTSPHPNTFSLVYGCVLGVPHYLSTFTFFFWNENRAVHREQWALFFGVPVLIVASLGLAVVFRIPFVIQVVVYVWNAYHVARQSCGILSIYRQRTGATDPAFKGITNSAIIWTSMAMAFWNISYYPTFDRFLVLIWSQLPAVVVAVTLAVAVMALSRLALLMVQRFRSPTPPQGPELAFLGTSLLLFHPYLWMRDADQATLCMLLGHFLQYLGIVWLVHRRKFSQQPAQAARGWLGWLSLSVPLLVLVLVVTGSVAATLRVLSLRQAIVVQALFSGGLLSIALVHFYLDGLFWAFRRPEVRQSLGPHLVAARMRPTAEGAN